MKIDELPTFRPPEMELEEDPRWNEEVVAISDLPQKRDAKTDPPTTWKWVAVYNESGEYQGVGRRGYVYWESAYGSRISPSCWSDILHW